MKTALLGFSGSGKTELFQDLAGPSGVNHGRVMVSVPEPRLQPLIAHYQPRKVTLATIEVLDTPGGGADKALPDRMLAEIRPNDCYLAVLDAFSGLVDPHKQWRDLEGELLLGDLAVAERKLERLALDKRKGKVFEFPDQVSFLERAVAELSDERPLRLTPELAQAPELKGFGFLSAKPVVWSWNHSDAEIGRFEVPDTREGEAHIPVCAQLERELAEFDDEEARAEFVADLGLADTALDRVVHQVYRLLGLHTFLTGGPKEVRSWPLRVGAPAPEAAGVIHSDLQRGFIRAEVMAFDDFARFGDYKRAKEAGHARLEGKDYVVRDGDILDIRFNV